MPHLPQEPSSSEQSLSGLQVLAFDAMVSPMSFLTLFGAVAHVDVSSTVCLGCLMAASAVKFCVQVAAVGAFLLLAGVVGWSLEIREIVRRIGGWFNIEKIARISRRDLGSSKIVGDSSHSALK
jgi:hypothetical protein